MEGRDKFFGGSERRGYVLLLVLLMVVILGLAFFYMRMHGPVYQIGEGESDIEPPWRQWHEMQVRLRRESFGPPTVEQPQLSKALEIRAWPEENGEGRGKIKVIMYPNGEVEGNWKGEFYVSKEVDFQVMTCKFEGNIDPEQIYSDEQGEDASRLFFIAKGHFSILETDSESGRVRNLMGNA